MDSTPTQPTPGSATPTNSPFIGSPAASSPAGDGQFSTTAAHATGTGKFPTDYTTPNSQPTASGVQGTLNNALASGKKWLEDSGISDKAQQLPQAAKELGNKAKDLSNKAVDSVSGLSTTQKAAVVGLLAAGVAFLITRSGGKKKKHKKHDGDYRAKAHRSPFDHQPHTKDGDYDRRGQRPWGGSRYGSAAGQSQPGRSRVSSGSGYTSSPSHSNDFGSQSGSHGTSQYGSDAQHSGQRRDQGPASGSRYDSQTSGSQNPNNLDQLNSAF
ncbi:MAG: hypothetical protein ACRYF0_04575 [Janthinobacterium lividum]